MQTSISSTVRSGLASVLLLATLMVGAHAADSADKASAPQKGALEVVLSEHKVVRNATGSEELQAAEKASPGDLIEYSSVYKNVSGQGIHQVAATLPVPHGTSYVAGTSKPRLEMASLDGISFSPVPLKRVVKDAATGKETTVEVPVSEYRALRWNIPSLQSGQSETIVARMRLNTNDVVSQAPVATPKR